MYDNPTYNLYKQVVRLSNNLDALIPIGTLHFYNLPTNISLAGLESPDEWQWLDIDFILLNCQVHPLIKDIRFLILYRYLMATYKVIRLSKDITIAKVRIYATAFDMDGSRYFNEWRDTRPRKNQVEKGFKSSWHRLINYLDYSNESWNDLKLSDLLIVPCSQVEATTKSFTIDENSKFHIERWYNNRRFELPKSNPYQSLLEKITSAYNDIQSPDISKYYNKSSKPHSNLPSAEEVIVRMVHNMLEGKSTIPGVKTQLYPFQIKSLSKMYEKESVPEKSLIPNFILLKSPNGKQTYYFDIINTGFFLKPELFQQPRGGILAENMGLGKTLICLSLICLTKWEISTLPDDYLTVVDLNDHKVREMVFDHEANQLVPKEPVSYKPIKKLTDLCKQHIVQNSLPWKYYSQDIPQNIVDQLNDCPGFFRIPLENSLYVSPFSIKRSRKSERLQYFDIELPKEGRTYRTLYYCNTTLIVVPDNLFHQWNTELKKHIEPNYLNKLFISNQFKRKVNSENGIFTSELDDDPLELIKYDLIIISHSILSKQFDENEIETPLLKIFWKRLIIDEGHSMSSKSSRAGLLCREMHSERRWAVTGTPTSGLTQLHMDQEEEEKKKNKYVVKSSFNEKEDLAKLGNIIGNFLKIEPFHSQPKLWQTTMIRPLVSNIYGSTTSLSNLLQSIVVRHSPDEVERDIKLPQLHHVSVFLKPSFHNKLAINIFTAVLAVNAVSSERKDVDYMFHPANRTELRRLITNLQRGTFHWSGFKQEDIESLLHVCKICLDKKDKYGKADRLLLQKSMDIANQALNNERWRTIALLHEMNYFVSGLPDVFTKTFGIGVLKSANKGNDLGIFGAPHINCVQEFFYKNRFMDMNNDEKLIEKLEEASKPFWKNYWDDTTRKNNLKFNADFSGDMAQQRLHNALEEKKEEKKKEKQKKRRNSFTLSLPKKKIPGLPKKMKVKKTDLDAEHSKEELSRADDEGLKITSEINTMYSLAKHNISYSEIKNSTILGTASAKLLYLTSLLLENQQQKIKSIVFFEFEDSAYYLTELLDVLGANYILYATFINTAQRAANLSEFTSFNSEKNGGITLIMDLRLAAHGLTIISATKVYFISPVWQRSVEAQAIKRAHRIGQTKEVHVETLVLEDTLEEEIYRRRSKSQTEKEEGEDSKKKYVIDDTGMQEFILRHRFLPMGKNELEYTPFKAPTSNPEVLVKPEEYDDPSALNQHQDSVESGQRNWKVFTFNRDNLGKLNVLKNQKVTRDFMKDQFIKSMVREDIEEVEVKKEEKTKKRKSVRF